MNDEVDDDSENNLITAFVPKWETGVGQVKQIMRMLMIATFMMIYTAVKLKTVVSEGVEP